MAPLAHAGKTIDSTFGEFGTLGGQFGGPRDVAVNEATGQVFVSDGGRDRIQRFDANNEFEIAWGRDVVQTGKSGDDPGGGMEICTAAGDCQSGAAGGLGGEFDGPRGIAIDPSTGDLFVMDRDNQRVQQFTFDDDGTPGDPSDDVPVFVRAWGWDVVQTGGTGDDTVAPADEFEVCTVAAECKSGAPGGGDGQFASSTVHPRLAVHPSTGEVLVTDPGSGASSTTNRRVQHFDPDAATDADVFVAAFGGPGTGTGQFTILEPQHVAVDSSGIVYISDQNANGRIQRYDLGASAFLSPIEVVPAGPLIAGGSGISSSGPTVGLEIDSVAGTLYAWRNSASSGEERVVQELDISVEPPTVVDTHMQGAGLTSNTNGLGLNGATGSLYGVHASEILVFDDDGANAALLSIAPASSIGAHEATLHGAVDPNGGLRASYQFQFSRNGVDWEPAAPPVDVGAGTGDIPVSDVLSGIEANTAYRVRLIATKPYGGPTAVSGEIPFITDAVPPEVTTGAVQHRTATSAQLLGTVNPNNLRTTYRFEYGRTDDYGSAVPVPDGSAGEGGTIRALMQTVDGLRPETLYHYRLVATNAEGTSAGADRTFTTRPLAPDAPGDRAYEMVTPADKNNRLLAYNRDRNGLPIPNPGIPSIDGDSLFYHLNHAILDPDAGTAFPHEADVALIRRAAGGWGVHPLHDTVAQVGAKSARNSFVGLSGDREVSAWEHFSWLFPSGSHFGTWIFGDTGGLEGSGWYDWLGSAALAASLPYGDVIEEALIGDGAERMLRWDSDSDPYRGLLGSSPADDPSNLQVDGRAVYLQEPVGSGPRTLLNACTGTVADGDATLIPMYDENGTPAGGPTAATASASTTTGSTEIAIGSIFPGFDPFTVGQVLDTSGGAGAAFPAGTTIVAASSSELTVSEPATATISDFLVANPNTAARDDDFVSSQPCESGAPTSIHGGAVGGTGSAGPGATAMSPDGRRMFFVSPDPSAPGTRAQCRGVGPDTDCPPQLFVRHVDSTGAAATRWISRSRVTVANGASEEQAPDLMGPALFEGASADGDVVYFRSTSPLVADDPNGGAQVPGGVTDGSDSVDSWDLYRYALHSAPDADPAGGDLTRITGGNDGTDDPNAKPTPTGMQGTAARFVSRDGGRVYFATAAPIAGADGGAPADGLTTPGGTVSNTATRNLYLYDDAKSGAARWKFVAQIPFAASGLNPDGCASSIGPSGMPRGSNTSGGLRFEGVNCIRGTSDGDLIAFQTTGRLTADDTDDAIDVYVYDAERDELTRISAPPAGVEPYECAFTSAGVVEGHCNGDLGFGSKFDPGEKVGLDGFRHFNVSDDGSVFFESRLPLVEDDVNGTHYDVYQWRAGELSLVSAGDSDDHSYYSGNTLDGDDVFVYTSKPISWREIDEADFDVYDARVGGGFPPPPPPPAPCSVLADACQGAGGAPVSASPQTTAGGGGNASPGPRVRIRVAAPPRGARRRAARTGVVRIRVRASRATRLRVVSRALVRRRSGRRAVRTVARRRLRLAKAGGRILGLRLNRVAMRQLRARGRLRMRVVVRAPRARPAGAAFVLVRGRR